MMGGCCSGERRKVSGVARGLGREVGPIIEQTDTVSKRAPAARPQPESKDTMTVVAIGRGVLVRKLVCKKLDHQRREYKSPYDWCLAIIHHIENTSVD